MTTSWSYEQAFQQMIDTLAQDVIPAIEDPFPKGQTVATRSILKNLKQRLRPRTDYLEASNEQIENLLDDTDESRLSPELEDRRDSLLSDTDREDPRKRNDDLNEFLEDLLSHLWESKEPEESRSELHVRVRQILRDQLDRVLEVTS